MGGRIAAAVPGALAFLRIPARPASHGALLRSGKLGSWKHEVEGRDEKTLATKLGEIVRTASQHLAGLQQKNEKDDVGAGA